MPYKIAFMTRVARRLPWRRPKFEIPFSPALHPDYQIIPDHNSRKGSTRLDKGLKEWNRGTLDLTSVTAPTLKSDRTSFRRVISYTARTRHDMPKVNTKHFEALARTSNPT